MPEPSIRPDSLRPRYDFELPDLEKDLGSRGIVFRAVARGSVVLDIGCDTGIFGEMLVLRRSCVVDGIEPDPHAGNIAQARLRQVFQRRIADEASFAGLSNGYDAVLLLDVLEHLYDPWAALRGILETLKPGGKLIIVTPNVGHYSVVKGLVLGRFDYTEHGTMDRTHLRWFTRRTLQMYLEDAGFVEIRITPVPVVPHFPPTSQVAQFLTRLLPDFFAGSLVAQANRPSTRYREHS